MGILLVCISLRCFAIAIDQRGLSGGAVFALCAVNPGRFMSSSENPYVVRSVDYDQLDSTNAEALRLAQAGERGPIWIYCDEQTVGRGRYGRVWQSAKGNLMASLLLQPSAPATVLHQLSLVAGVAIIDAVRRLAVAQKEQLALKWPNDLLLGTAKAGGILIESTQFDGAQITVIGIGLNVQHAPVVEGVKTAALSSVFGADTALAKVRNTVAERMKAWLEIWSHGQGFSDIRQVWLENGPQIGDPITVKVADTVHHGAFSGLDDDGSLLVRAPSGTIECYTFGDVSLPA